MNSEHYDKNMIECKSNDLVMTFCDIVINDISVKLVTTLGEFLTNQLNSVYEIKVTYFEL